MNQGPKAKIEIEIDDAEARRQLEALRAEFGGPSGGGPGGGGGGGGFSPRVPGRGVPGAGGGGGMGLGLSAGKVMGGIIGAAVAVAMKDVMKDAMSGMTLLVEEISTNINKFVDNASGGRLGEFADENRASLTVKAKAEAFGRETMGYANERMLHAIMDRDFYVERRREEGARAARYAWGTWSRPNGQSFR